MNYYPIGEFAKRINVTHQTLRNWHNEGKLIPAYISQGGHRH